MEVTSDRRLVVLAFVCVALAATVAAAAPLPAEFGGGFIPPNSQTKNHERSAASFAADLVGNPLNSLLYCGWRGVDRVRAGKPSQVAECFDRWTTIFNGRVGRIRLPACVDLNVARALARGIALNINGTFWCAPPAGTPLPPEFGGDGFLPLDRATFLGEKGIAQAFAKMSQRASTCYRRGVDNVFNGNPSDVYACVADASGDFTAQVAALVPPRRMVPACMLDTSALAGLADAFARVMVPVFYCAE